MPHIPANRRPRRTFPAHCIPAGRCYNRKKAIRQAPSGKEVFPLPIRFFGQHIEPACTYCARGLPAGEGENILCPRYGVVRPYFRCRAFRYDPLRRVPHVPPPLPTFSMEDFML